MADTPSWASREARRADWSAEEPARYGTLHHPGDQYALDMYAQIGKALLRQRPPALGGLRPKHVVALGESQSAFYLTTFADALQPADPHLRRHLHPQSRRQRGAAERDGDHLGSGSEGPAHPHRPPASRSSCSRRRPISSQLGYAPAQQPNTARIRTWEVAGTSHADAYEVGPALSLLGCTTPVNNGPQHNVVQAAFAAFNRWVDHGTPPPSPPRFRLASTNPPALALDAHGNVIGGVRTPTSMSRSRRSAAPRRPGPVRSARCSGSRPRSHRPCSPVSTAVRPTISRLPVQPGQGHRRGLHPGRRPATLLAQAKQVSIP